MGLRKMTEKDLYQVSHLFVDAFSRGRFDDGYLITDVPACDIDFLDMYLQSCKDGCFVYEEKNSIVAAVFSHVWGETGWLGPLGVVSRCQKRGFGTLLTRRSISFLKQAGCKIIGLETNPRSFRNLGFYSKLGFSSHFLTFDLLKRVQNNNAYIKREFEVKTFAKCSPAEKEDFIKNVRRLSGNKAANIDYNPLIKSTFQNTFGDSFLFFKENDPVAYATFHLRSPSKEEKHSVVRTIAFVARKSCALDCLEDYLEKMESLASNKSINYILIRMSSYYQTILNALLKKRFNIINSDVRMTVEGYAEIHDPDLVHLTRWV